jgi:hypothetical protein
MRSCVTRRFTIGVLPDGSSDPPIVRFRDTHGGVDVVPWPTLRRIPEIKPSDARCSRPRFPPNSKKDATPLRRLG